jgi:hypothetical protein
MKSPFDKQTNILDLDVVSMGVGQKSPNFHEDNFHVGEFYIPLNRDMPTKVVKVKKANTRKTKLFREDDFTSKVGTYKEKPTFLTSVFHPFKSY